MKAGFELSYTPTNFRILINQIDIKKYVPFEYKSVQYRDKSLQRILLPSLSLSLSLFEFYRRTSPQVGIESIWFAISKRSINVYRCKTRNKLLGDRTIKIWHSWP